MAKTKLAILLTAILCLGAFVAVADTPQKAWAGSAHANAKAEAFAHWNNDDPAVVPTRCAKCHSGTGFLDFLGADGTEAGVVNNAAKVGSVITCDACHAGRDAASVTFPSGAVVDMVANEAACARCHQGRSYGGAVDAAVAGFDADAAMPKQGFINVHYAAAAATRQGSISDVGYQYAGKTYVGKFAHTPGFDVCADCHDQHSLKVKVNECATCHGSEDPATFRMSAPDYDGDGADEGVKGEIDTLHNALYAAIQAYAANAGAPIVYASDTYPYWMNDTNGNGVVDEGEASYGNQYKGNFTPRLLKATYNYQLVAKELGFYAHNAKYAVELLIDSIADLGGDVSAYTRP